MDNDDGDGATEHLKAARGGESGGGAEPARDSLWRALAAELLATALLVLGSCLPGAGRAADPLRSALAAGAVVTMLVQSFDHISGAMMNPAVSLAAALSGRVSWRRGALYAAAQAAGGAAGAAALAALAAGGAAARCVTRPAAGLAAWRAALLEAALAGCLALVNCAAWDGRTLGRADSWPLRIGATVAALSLAAGELTGASMNPVRSFGPALCAGDWQDHWVYWAGPLCGAGAAALLYRALWRTPPPRGAPRPAGAPRRAPRRAPAPPPRQAERV